MRVRAGLFCLLLVALPAAAEELVINGSLINGGDCLDLGIWVEASDTCFVNPSYTLAPADRMTLINATLLNQVTVRVRGELVVSAGAFIVNNGLIVNTGLLTNRGILRNNEGGRVDNDNLLSIDESAQLVNDGLVNNNTTGLLVIEGLLQNNATLSNCGTIIGPVGGAPPVSGDGDLDGFCNAADCAPDNGQVWRVPGEAGDLLLFPSGGATAIRWLPPEDPGGTSVRYDLLVSELSGDFEAADCFQSDSTDTQALDPITPAPGIARHYLVRAVNECGDGTGGTRSSGAPRPLPDCP